MERVPCWPSKTAADVLEDIKRARSVLKYWDGAASQCLRIRTTLTYYTPHGTHVVQWRCAKLILELMQRGFPTTIALCENRLAVSVLPRNF